MRIYTRSTLAERFWTKVRKTETCWIWEASTVHGGYGKFFLEKQGRRSKFARAHVVAYTLTKGPVPPGLLVLHTCDVRLCVRPEHLFAGTQQVNIRDAMKKGRWVAPPRLVGESHPHARLTEDQVVQIRHRAAARESLHDLATEYGVAHSTIENVVYLHSWKHVTNPPAQPPETSSRALCSVVSPKKQPQSWHTRIPGSAIRHANAVHEHAGQPFSVLKISTLAWRVNARSLILLMSLSPLLGAPC